MAEIHTEHSHNRQENHVHTHGHSHEHHHGKAPLVLFLLGLLLFVIGLFLGDQKVIQNIVYTFSMIMAGYHVVIEGIVETISSTKEQGKFTPNVHILMTLAAIGASIIGDFQEGALLILIFAGAHFLEEYAEGKSRREITNLMKMNPTEGRLLKNDGTTELVAVNTLKIGDKLQVLNGDQVPTDGVILSGYSSIDESSINGESIPREKTVGDEVFGSTINGTGSFTMEVTRDNKDTLFAKIIQLVDESQGDMSKTATKIQKIEPIYVKTILVLVPLFIVVMPFIMGWDWTESFYRGMVFLTVASPCALAASATPATLSAISNLAKRGVLFKGGSYLTNLADIKAVAFDKTGTLTAGKPVVTDYHFTTEASQTYLDIIIAMERTANHPLATAILSKFTASSELTLSVENQVGRGLVSQYRENTYQIGKPEIFENVSAEIANYNQKYASEGKTVVYFAEDEQVIGLIAMMDIPNAQSKEVVEYLKNQGVHTTMITGDAKRTGEAIGQAVGIDEVVGNVLPENKAEIIKKQQAQYGPVAMLGDGVNDAPALVTADIGIAMGDGTDVAMDVADAVLMQNDLTKLAYAHQVSKKLNRIVRQNIWFAMLVVVLLVVLNIMGQMNLPIGVLFHEGSTILVLINGLRLLKPIPLPLKK